MIRPRSNADQLAADFLEEAKSFQADIEPVQVLKSRTFQIGNAHVLVRAASDGNRNYFFGINYLALEEIANLENPFIAFICGSVDRTLIIPAKLFFKQLPNISHDRNGEYKINITSDLNLALKGRNNRLQCAEFLNNWNLLLASPAPIEQMYTTVEESLHSILQGRLIEIGNIRGFQTYTPDKSRIFNEVSLGELTTLASCPTLQFSDYELLRKIDVIWFKNRGTNLVPDYAFEVELTTGVWSGVGRMATLIDYSNVGLYVISNDPKKFNQVVASFPEVQDRFRFVANEALGDLYSAEINLKQMRYDIGL